MARRANSLQRLVDQLNTQYPNRLKASDGWIGDARHSSKLSQHNPNTLGIVTAQDITSDPVNGLSGDTLASLLIQDSRVWYVIWNRRIWEGSWKSYNGDPHDKHVHVSVKQVKSDYDNATNWNIGVDEMLVNNESEYNRISTLHRRVRGKHLTKEQFDALLGKDYRSVVDAIINNPEADANTAMADLGRQVVAQGFKPGDAKVDEAIKQAQEALDAIKKLKEKS